MQIITILHRIYFILFFRPVPPPPFAVLWGGKPAEIEIGKKVNGLSLDKMEKVIHRNQPEKIDSNSNIEENRKMFA